MRKAAAALDKHLERLTKAYPIAVILVAEYQRRRQELEMLRKISPMAWQHIHFLGHYLFRNEGRPIDLEAILAHTGFS